MSLRVLFYAPGILSVSVLGIIGIRIWDTQLGVVNYFFTTLLHGPRISWLGYLILVLPAAFDNHCLVDLWVPNACLPGGAAKHSRNSL